MKFGKWSTKNLLERDIINIYCSACDTAHNKSIDSRYRNNCWTITNLIELRRDHCVRLGSTDIQLIG